MKRLLSFLMCLMIGLFLSITPAQSKSVVGSDMGIPTICNLESNYISPQAGNIQLMQSLQNWGLLYTQIGAANLYTIQLSAKIETRIPEIKTCHYDPGWQMSQITYSEKNTDSNIFMKNIRIA
ncbi:MAG: hypothetical protein JJE17_08815 [Peptostreptococcaceae bacterium]|nr:hypothetical protein [Peptostreptococcaceae bacterium]